ncbi:MAG: UDP-N-acetylmuramoyl-tripeptide--D-alanyl-D-alanine ligase [Chlamydiales bacterium]
MKVAIDSRMVELGGTFFALKGEKVDGHNYLKEVAEKGAAEVVVEEYYTGPDFGMNLCKVPDVKEELRRRAREKRKTFTGKVVGITGSVGKTTTKEFLATLLESTFSVGKNFGSYNSQLTLPLTILNCEGDVWVLEMGMSRPGELACLTEIAQPEIVLVTKIAYSHSEFFDDLQGIARAKAEIIKSPRLEKAFVGEQVREFSPFEKGVVPKEVEIELPFAATHLRENFFLAKAAAEYLGVPLSEICKQAKKLSPFSRRFERIEVGGICFINDTYNANPASVKAALANLPEGNRRIAVLGEMRELGKFSQECHKDVSAFAKKSCDRLFTLGEAFVGESIDHFSEKEKLLDALRKELREGDVVLLKGSNSLQMWTLLDHLSSEMA